MAAVVGLIAHGGATGVIIEASLALGIVAIGLIAWLASRKENR